MPLVARQAGEGLPSSIPPDIEAASAPLELQSASALNNLASLEDRRERWESAGHLLKQAYAILEQNQPPVLLWLAWSCATWD